MKRLIRFGSKFDPNKSELVSNMGVRELTLVGIAGLQALYWLFVVTSMPFVSRLTLAGLIGLILTAIALVPIKDKKIEWHLAQFVRYKLRPARRIHQTAKRQPFEETEAPTPKKAASPKPQAHNMPRPVYQRRARGLSLSAALPLLDPVWIVAAFACVLVIASVIAYVGRGGSLG
jgi:hypothetical protein